MAIGTMLIESRCNGTWNLIRHHRLPHHHNHHENLLHARQPTLPPSTVQPFWRLANALEEFHGED